MTVQKEGKDGGGNQSQSQQSRLPPEILDIMLPALQVGGIAGKLHISRGPYVTEFISRDVGAFLWEFCRSSTIEYSQVICIGVRNSMVHSGDHVFGYDCVEFPFIRY
jgi:hypothetical protein